MKKETTKTLFLITCLLYFGLYAYALKPVKTYKIKPDHYKLLFNEFKTRTPDGYNINTWFLPAQSWIKQDCVFKLSKTEATPTIIICDGDAGNMTGHLFVAKMFVQYGYNVVLFDWRGFGESDSFLINQDNLCYTEFLTDYIAVIDTIASFPNVENIGIMGFSTGAYLSMAAAYINPHVKCFMGRALMTCFDDIKVELKKLESHKSRDLIAPFDYPKELEPKYLAPVFNKPAFLIVGENDNRTPVAMSQKIYDLLNVEKELWIVEGASHGYPNAPERNPDFFDRAHVFFRKYLRQ